MNKVKWCDGTRPMIPREVIDAIVRGDADKRRECRAAFWARLTGQKFHVGPLKVDLDR